MDEKLDLPFDAGFSGGIVDSTGLIRIAGELEIKPGKLSVKLPAFLGYVFDDVELQAYKVQFAGIGDYTPAFLTTHDHTYVLIDRDGQVVVQFTEPTTDEKRMNIYLCDIIHPNGLVDAIVPKFDYVVQGDNVLGDALRFLDPVIRGCKVVPNGLNLDIYSGSILIRNSEDLTRTDVIDISAANSFSFVYTMTNSVYSGLTTIIDPNNYDNGNVLTAVPPGLYTVQRIGITHLKEYVVQYGTVVHPSLTSALGYITDADINFEVETGLAQGAVLAYLIVQQGSATIQAYRTNNFGEAVEPVGAIAAAGALLVVNNLSDLSNVATAQLNLGAGAVNGLATLDALGKLTSSQLPFTKQYYGYSNILQVHNVGINTVLESVVDNTTTVDATFVRLQFYVDVVDRTLYYELYNETAAALLASGILAVSGFQNIVVVKPVASSVLSVKMNKNLPGGTDPTVRGLVISYE